MAEAIVNNDLAGRWTALSAGTALTGYVHPLALKALAEIGILHQGTSKSVEVFRSQAFDPMITV
jgi:arsenate reductase (thioredoxin)